MAQFYLDITDDVFFDKVLKGLKLRYTSGGGFQALWNVDFFFA